MLPCAGIQSLWRMLQFAPVFCAMIANNQTQYVPTKTQWFRSCLSAATDRESLLAEACIWHVLVQYMVLQSMSLKPCLQLTGNRSRGQASSYPDLNCKIKCSGTASLPDIPCVGHCRILSQGLPSRTRSYITAGEAAQFNGRSSSQAHLLQKMPKLEMKRMQLQRQLMQPVSTSSSWYLESVSRSCR